MSGRRGFTLIELVIAAALGAVVATVLAGAFAAGLRLWERSRYGGAECGEMAIALELLQKDIRNTVPCRLAAFRGEKSWVEIPSIIPGTGADGTTERAGLIRYERGRKGRTLERAARVYRFPLPAEERRETVMTAVDEVTFAFASAGGAVPAPLAWSPDWVGRTNLPAAVRIKAVTRQDGERIEWQRTVVLPRR